MDHTNCYADSSSLSTILIKNPLDFSSPQLHLVNHYYKALKAFCKHQLKFDLNNPKYRSSHSLPDLKPLFGLQTNASGYTFVWSFQRKLANQLRDLLLTFNSQDTEVQLKKSLGFQIDPWDHYFWFDASYWINLLLHSVD